MGLTNKIQVDNVKINALIAYNFMKMFNVLEKKVKQIFKDAIINVDSEIYNKICFYIGGIRSNKIFIEYGHGSLKKEISFYKKNRLCNDLTFNQIIRIDEVEKVISSFEIDINSIQHKTFAYPFHQCCLKIISMRNKLSHEIDNISFNDKEIIEQLTRAQIDKNEIEWLKNIDISNIDDYGINILSNYIIMLNIISELNKKDDTYGFQEMDT